MRSTQLNSNYRDAYLYAIWCESGVGEAIEDPWFTGYTHEPRWMVLRASRARMRCTDRGIILQAPADEDQRARLESVIGQRGDVKREGADWLLTVRQVGEGDEQIDVEDRVQKAADLLRALVAEGL